MWRSDRIPDLLLGCPGEMCAQNIWFSCAGVSSRVLSVPNFVVASTVVHTVDNLHCVTLSHLAQENSTIVVIFAKKKKKQKKVFDECVRSVLAQCFHDNK